QGFRHESAKPATDKRRTRYRGSQMPRKMANFESSCPASGSVDRRRRRLEPPGGMPSCIRIVGAGHRSANKNTPIPWRTTMSKRLIAALAAALLSLVGLGGPAAAYPERPITLLVGFPAGGNVDIAARQAQPFMEKYLGGNIAVVNRPGAGGAIAYTEAA